MGILLLASFAISCSSQLSPAAVNEILHDKYAPAPCNFIASNAIPFSFLVTRLEVLETNRATVPSKSAMLEFLLPLDLFKNFLNAGSSGFPYLRLLMPQIDTSRPGHYGMKEAQIAEVWGLAMGLDPKSEAQQVRLDEKRRSAGEKDSCSEGQLERSDSKRIIPVSI